MSYIFSNLNFGFFQQLYFVAVNKDRHFSHEGNTRVPSPVFVFHNHLNVLELFFKLWNYRRVLVFTKHYVETKNPFMRHKLSDI